MGLRFEFGFGFRAKEVTLHVSHALRSLGVSLVPRV